MEIRGTTGFFSEELLREIEELGMHSRWPGCLGRCPVRGWVTCRARARNVCGNHSRPIDGTEWPHRAREDECGNVAGRSSCDARCE